MISVSDGQVYTAFAVTLFAGLATVVGGGLILFLKKPNFRLLAFGLAFAAGAMIYVVVEELIPELQIGSHSNIGTIGVALGFTVMMILDVALG